MKAVNAILLIILFIMLWARWFGTGGTVDLQEKTHLYTEQLKINKELQQRNEKLKAEVLDLKNGLEAIEERARSEMGMIKSAEDFIQVIEDN